MPISPMLTYDPDDDIVRSTFQGILNMHLFREYVPNIARFIKEHNCYRMLTDIRQARLEFSVTGIYMLPELFSSILAESGVTVNLVKRAMVVADDFEDAIFYETVSRNRNQNVRIFTDIEEARQWLLTE